jgi:hypothetical protein
MTGTTVEQLRLTGFQASYDRKEAIAVRVGQNSFLSELPGAAFAFLTLAYVVLSLLSL